MNCLSCVETCREPSSSVKLTSAKETVPTTPNCRELIEPVGPTCSAHCSAAKNLLEYLHFSRPTVRRFLQRMVQTYMSYL